MLTKQEIEALEEQLATQIMRWKPTMSPVTGDKHYEARGGISRRAVTWRPSSNWDCAGELADRLAMDGFNISMANRYGGLTERQWRALIFKPGGYAYGESTDDSGPMALAVAASRMLKFQEVAKP